MYHFVHKQLDVHSSTAHVKFSLDAQHTSRLLMQHAKLYQLSVLPMELDVFHQQPVQLIQHRHCAVVFENYNFFFSLKGNLATSGAKSCTWTASGSTGTCADKVCSDAPATFTTQS